MPQCAVATCKNSHRKTKGRRVRYHRFPAEDDVRKRWVAACGREGFANGAGFNTATARVCSLHFSPSSYERDVEHELLGLPPRSRLKRGAVPDRAVPITLPSLIGRKKPATRNKQSIQQQVNSNSGGGSKRRAATKQKPPKEDTDDVNDVIDTSPSSGIDILLAVGLTPRKKEEYDDQTRPSRMYIMDDECSKTTFEEPSSDIKMSPKPCKISQKLDKPVIKSCKESKDANVTETVPAKCEDKSSEIVSNKEQKPEENDTKDNAKDAIHGKVNGVIDKSKVEKTENTEVISGKTEDKPFISELTNGECEKQTSSRNDSDMENAGIHQGGSSPTPSYDNCDVSGTTSPESQGVDTKKTHTRSKRSSSESDSDTPSILKKMKLSEAEYEERDRAVNSFMETTSGTNIEELQRCITKLHQEIQTLGTLAKAKEVEWNNIIRLKKVKEEMHLRLLRKKQIMLLLGPSKGEVWDWDFLNELRFGDFYGQDNMALNRMKTPDGSLNLIKPSNSKYGKDQSHNVQVSLQQQPSSTTGMSLLKGGQSLVMFPMVSSGSAHLSKSLTITATPAMPHSTAGNSSSLKATDLSNRDKVSGRIQRPILPKPASILMSGGYGTAASAAITTTAGNNNGQNPVIGEGRQGPILDVRSIIADYRSRHPETVPRRGRRMRTGLSPTSTSQLHESLVTSTRMSGSGGILSMSSLALGSGSQMRAGTSSDMADLGFITNHVSQDASRPSSADSCRSGAPSHTVTDSGPTSSNGISFKDVLVQFAKLSQAEQRHDPIHTPTSSTKPPPYPEVTLHPVLAPQSPPQPSSSSSLLHGILTKSSNSMQHRAETLSSKPSTFSPTLARLLTAPERLPGNMVTNVSATFHHPTGHVSIGDLLSSSKQTRNEITITPVTNHMPGKTKDELMEEEQEDSADRLVIDESRDTDSGRGRAEPDDDASADITSDDVPECQGCHQRAAQFVCAGCGNQWYCSRDCQVAAWDEHSEVCSG